MKPETIIIAEAGVNHNGDEQLAIDLVQAAAEAGADYVKFQTFDAASLVSRLAKRAAYQMIDGVNDEFQYTMLKQLELPRQRHELLMEECKSSGIGFLSSAFDMDSLDYLSDLKLDYLKIPSGEITNLPYLRKSGTFKGKILLSTGMSDLSDIDIAINTLTKSGAVKEDIILLQCNTAYPTPYCDVHLHAMQVMTKEFGLKVGYSDHTNGIEVALAAVALGACVIEKHFTLNRNLPGPDHKASLEPSELKSMVKAIRNIEDSLGLYQKVPTPSELVNRNIARKSIHLKVAKSAGDVIHESDLAMKRPGDGISPMNMDNIIGKTVTHACEADHKLVPGDINW